MYTHQKYLLSDAILISIIVMQLISWSVCARIHHQRTNPYFVGHSNIILPAFFIYFNHHITSQREGAYYLSFNDEEVV